MSQASNSPVETAYKNVLPADNLVRIIETLTENIAIEIPVL
jgi:hypothetical protein